MKCFIRIFAVVVLSLAPVYAVAECPPENPLCGPRSDQPTKKTPVLEVENDAATTPHCKPSDAECKKTQNKKVPTEGHDVDA